MAARMGYLFKVNPIVFLEMSSADWLLCVASYQVVQGDKQKEAEEMKKSTGKMKRR